MNYEAAVRYLLSLGRELAAPTQAAAAKFDLENITILAERLGRPDRAYPTAHIAGTNGKGSTAAFLESILRRAGFRTGLNTSPHLEKINERIRVNGEEISDEAFAETFTRIQALNEELLAAGKLRAHPTYFECVTAMAFEYFARARVDFGVFEVGLGRAAGRHEYFDSGRLHHHARGFRSREFSGTFAGGNCRRKKRAF